MTSTANAVHPAEAWAVVDVFHLSTGQTISPDEQTGDEWSIERVNVHCPHARVVTTYAVIRRATDEAGNWLDTSEIPDEDAHPHWRYSVDERSEFVVSLTPDDFWSHADQAHIEYGEGSYLDYETEEAADDECRRMAERDAAMTGIITWDGSPSF